MLTSSKLAVFARSFSSCSSYCSAMPARQVPAGVLRIRASCAAVRDGPASGERRVREPVPTPRMERRNRPLFSALVVRSSPVLSVVTRKWVGQALTRVGAVL
jgi:hypothetical protein